MNLLLIKLLNISIQLFFYLKFEIFIQYHYKHTFKLNE